MKVMAQTAMVRTSTSASAAARSVTCKQVWTNREGTEQDLLTTSKTPVLAWLPLGGPEEVAWLNALPRAACSSLR